MQTLTSIDMFTPAQTSAQLQVDEQRLLDMVNAGHLAAYNIGGEIRFKIVDVLAATAVFAAA